MIAEIAGLASLRVEWRVQGSLACPSDDRSACDDLKSTDIIHTATIEPDCRDD